MNEKCTAKKFLPLNITVAVFVMFLLVSCGGGGGGGTSININSETNITNQTPAVVYTRVSANDLDQWLQAQNVNNPATAYQLEITDLTPGNYTGIRTALTNNPNKYVDLSGTQLPAGITSLYGESNGFKGCTTLTKAPHIPDSVTNIQYCFQNCTALTEAPDLPAGIQTLYCTFSGCSALTEPPVIPESVTIIARCFELCSSLVEAPNIPNNVINMSDCFYGCSSLETVPSISTNVTNMFRCFCNCTAMTQVPDIPQKVDNMQYCFSGCTSLESVRIKTTKVSYGNWEKCFENNCNPAITVPTTGVQTNITNWTSCHSHLTSVAVEQAQ